jgi:protein-L-isoaspartate O-methyltransferase
MLGGVAGALSRSPLLRRGRELWEKNQKDWNLPLSRWDKLRTGMYLILKDYSEGEFPPTFSDQQQTYQNEINYRSALPGTNLAEVAAAELAKPFWFGRSLHLYLGAFLKLASLLEEIQITPPAKLLELGGGSGWTAEFLAQLGFNIVSTTLSPSDSEAAQKRLESLQVRGLRVRLQFQVCPMETAHEHVHEQCPFDAVFVHEALHHAFDWKAAVSSAYSSLRPGGWLLICSEPNVLHTMMSYRVAKLSHTHEVGFSRGELVRHLRQTGFQRVLSRGRRLHWLVHPHWLVAQR